MNKQIEEKLIGYLDQAEGVTIDAYQLIQEQAPILMEEIVKWHHFYFTVSAVIFTAIAFLLFVAGVAILVIRHSEINEDVILGFVFIIVASMFFTYGAITQWRQAHKAKIAPRLVVMEKIGELR